MNTTRKPIRMESARGTEILFHIIGLLCRKTEEAKLLLFFKTPR